MRARLALLLCLCGPAHAASLQDLVRAYPDFLAGTDGTSLIWRDGTRMPVVPGILDQLALPYPEDAPLTPPLDDPGRSRDEAFFDKMYGDCRAGQVAPKLVRVVWLPHSWGHEVRITAVNGIDRALAAVSQELDALPEADKRFLYPIGGTYNCRAVAGSTARSMHGWGAAIDINPAYADYWRWRNAPDLLAAYRNRIPAEIVASFERHGFIWGGRWSHFDTMHFEYRPELLMDRRR